MISKVVVCLMVNADVRAIITNHHGLTDD